MNPWDAEVVVDVALATRLVRSQFPSVPGEVRLLGSGWDNEVFAVGESVAFRFPRREAALPLQVRELTVLPVVAALPLPVPAPTWFGTADADYPWPFWGGPLVEGQELCHATADRVALGASVGAFIRALHALPVTVDLPYDPMRRADPQHRATMAATALEQLAELGLADGPPYRVAEGVGVGTGRVLSHGDLHLRHVLARPDGTAAGVIDWGDACLADPSVDLSFAFGALEGAAREAFFDAYGPVDAACEARARVLAVQLCAVLALSAHDTGNAALLAESLAGVRRAQQ